MTRHLQAGAEKAAQKAPELFTLVILVGSFFWFADRAQKMAADSFEKQRVDFVTALKNADVRASDTERRTSDILAQLSARIEANTQAIVGLRDVLSQIRK